MRDHGHHKVHEWLMGEEVSSKSRESSNPRHYGGDTSRRSIPPKKVDLSLPSYHTKVSSWLSSNFTPSKNLIQSKSDNVNHIVKERVKHRAGFVADDDEKESTAVHEEDARPTFNDGVSSIVKAEDECEPSKALQVLSIETKPNEIAKVNEYLGNKQERKENIECEKRLKCEMQKPRESGGGECESKLSREKNYKHVRKKSGLLDYKVNLGWALDNPLPFALGEGYKLLPTNTSYNSFCVDEPFIVSKIEDMEVRHHVANGLETTSPKNDQEEQEQVEELLAQGSSALSLLPCDISLKCLNKIDFAKPMCDDSFVIRDLWHQEFESLNAKSIFASYVDPFLRNSSIDKHVIFIVDSNLKDEMTFLHAKMFKFTLIHNFEFHKYVDENSRTKRIEIVDDFRTWYLLCFHCKMVRPFNGIGMFYGRFVKDFSTHISFVRYVVIKVIIMHCSHVCAYVLKLLEQLRGTYFDETLMLCVVAFYKFHMYDFVFIPHVVPRRKWIHCSYIFYHFLKLLGQWCEIYVDECISLIGISSCKLHVSNNEPILYVEHECFNLNKNDVSMVDDDLSLHDLKNEVSFVLDILIAKFDFKCDGGSWFVDYDCENHLLVNETSFGFQSEINFLYDTMIFDLDSLDFVGVLDRDLRTNPSKEGGDDANPGVLKKNRRTGFEDKSFHKEGEDDVNPGERNHRAQRCRGPWVDWGPRRGWRDDKEPNRNWGSVQTSIYLSRWCPNALLIPPLPSSSKYLREGTSHAPNGVRMREIWPFDESRAELPTN